MFRALAYLEGDAMNLFKKESEYATETLNHRTSWLIQTVMF